jgi:WD40 repeat protein
MKNDLRPYSLVNRFGLFTLLFLMICQLGFAQKIEPKLILPIGHTKSVESATFSPDGKSIVTISWDETPYIDAKHKKYDYEISLNTVESGSH